MKSYSGKIVIIGAENFLHRLLTRRFRILGYKVFSASDDKTRVIFLKNNLPDLFICVRFSTKIVSSGFHPSITKLSTIPTVILTPNDILAPKKKSPTELEYHLVKPVSLQRLESLVNFILLPPSAKQPDFFHKRQKIFYLNNLIVDLTQKQVFRKNVKLDLTGTEFNLLRLFVTNIGKSLTRSTILSKIWDYIPERDVDTRLIDVHISRLRSKIEENPRKPNLIITIRGIGYKLNPSKTEFFYKTPTGPIKK